VARIKTLTEEDGPDLWVHGSGILIQTLLKHHLLIGCICRYTLLPSAGKRLFAEGTQGEMLELVDSKISTSGIIFATYEPTGDLKTS